GKAITVADRLVTLEGEDASNYTLSLDDGLLDNLTADIAPATLTVGGSYTASNKVYDATTVADINAGELNIAGLYDGDDVTIKTSGAKGVFADKNVGTGKAVTLAANGSGVLSGEDAHNYVVNTSGLSEVTADITPATLTVGGSFTAVNKVYNATTVADIIASGLNIAGLYDGDDVTIKTSGAKGVFADKNVGAAKKVTLAADGSGVLSGEDARNYVLNTSGLSEVTADITPATLTLDGGFTELNKMHNATTEADIDAGGLNIVGLYHGDDVTIKTVGAKGVF